MVRCLTPSAWAISAMANLYFLKARARAGAAFVVPV
jgi:hypothetical protein